MYMYIFVQGLGVVGNKGICYIGIIYGLYSLLTTSKFGVGMGFYTGMPYGNGQANGNSCMVWD